MLYTVFKSDGHLKERQWHVGEPYTSPTSDFVLDVVEVSADGDELRYLYRCFPGLPRVKSVNGIYLTDKPVVRFVGDWAAFIAANL